MKARTLMSIIILLIIGIFIAGATTYADDIKARMKKRLPEIKALKAKGIVGEDNEGYLQFVGGDKAGADIVAAENKDRRTVYEAIAKQQGTTPEIVGQRRALQIAKKARSGEWVQDAGGQWQQK